MSHTPSHQPTPDWDLSGINDSRLQLTMDAWEMDATSATLKFALPSQKMETEGEVAQRVEAVKISTQRCVLNRWNRKLAVEETAGFTT